MEDGLWLRTPQRQYIELKNSLAPANPIFLNAKLFDENGKDVSIIGIKRTGLGQKFAMEFEMEGSLSTIYHGHVLLRGVSSDGSTGSGQIYFVDRMGKVLVKISHKLNGTKTIMRLDFKNLDDFQENVKSAKFEEVTILLEDLRFMKFKLPVGFVFK
jgi:hypothetical protein